MMTLLNPTIQLIEQNPDVKSFIYQQIAEFDNFVTPQTMVSVVARDPKKLAIQYETDGIEFSQDELKKLYRIAIVLNESGTKVEAEGVSEDIYQAITLAKDSLLQKLVAIQDSVVSHQDRIIEINHYLQHPVLH
ncbi:MAG TPA: HPF/RaiA family ribosome-associated protein [Bdellovibrio sp.]|nr:HPF/RaiA family ribosome-associated protein [Bdellovibrio sp.]